MISGEWLDSKKLENTDWIEPGKYIGLWWEMIGTNQSTWGSGAHHGAKTEKVKEYIDFGSKHGFKGVLVEGWNKRVHAKNVIKELYIN